jgi:enterochelin esterase-like enzyme
MTIPSGRRVTFGSHAHRSAHIRTSRRVLLGCLGGILVGLVTVAAAFFLPGTLLHTRPPQPSTHVLASASSRHRASTRSGQAVEGQIAPALEARIGRETGGVLSTVHFYSHALRKRADYMVFRPAGYTASRRLPVFYMLHGMPGKPQAFTVNANIEVRLEHIIAARLVSPMLLVFPDGRVDGRTASDSEWANTPSGAYETYITDVIRDVDQRFATLACRQERAIAGISAGAYGAANIGLHHDSKFGLVQVWSGYFRETHNGVFAHATPAIMAYNSPIEYVRTMRKSLHRFPLRIFIYGGRDDPDSTQIPQMAAALRAEGAHVGAAIYAGGHSWNTWTPHVDQMLIMASHDFAHPLDGAPASCG